jgi:NAD(P)H-flavin reductase/ferredoxin
MPTLTLPQIGRRIEMKPGQTILAAALEAQVPYPHSCQSGRCGACKSQLLEGAVTMGQHTRFALTDEEKAANQILACRSVPQGDVTVAWLDGEDAIPVHSPMRHQAQVVAIDAMTHDIRRIRLVPEDSSAFRFQPGQYVRLTVDGLPSRDYSLASLPGDDHIEIHVRAVPGGRASSRIVADLRIGDIVDVEGPFGSAFLREAHKGPIIAVAGGSGLAPIKSIVESALVADPAREVHIYFGGRTARDVYLADHFRGLAAELPNVSYQAVLSEVAAPGWRSGYLSDAIAEDHVNLSGAKLYAAGPPSMVDAVRAAAHALGVKHQDIHADVFFTPETDGAKIAEEVLP